MKPRVIDILVFCPDGVETRAAIALQFDIRSANTDSSSKAVADVVERVVEYCRTQAGIHHLSRDLIKCVYYLSIRMEASPEIRAQLAKIGMDVEIRNICTIQAEEQLFNFEQFLERMRRQI